MKVFENTQDIPDEAKGCVIVIGNFDGVHKGHQAVLARAKLIAADKGAALGILTFEPHPRKLFRPDEPPARITPLSLKANRLEKENVDYLFALPFDWDLASQSADDFIDQILKDMLGALHIVIGYDFRFGQMRKGEPAMIDAAGIPTTIIKEVGENLSSSSIRAALRHGDVTGANEMLGWKWEIQGEVIHGDKRGREMGFPTANLKLGETVHPAYGVYAARVQIEGEGEREGEGEGEWYSSAINIGIRPMFEVEEALLEAHIFNFDRDIYGKTLRVQLVERLRSEAKFDDLDALIVQIEEDCNQAQEVLG